MMTTLRCAAGVSLRKNIDGFSRRAAGHDCDANNSRPELIHINFRGMARWHIDVTGLLSMGGPGHRPSRQRTCVMTPKQCADILYADARKKGAALPAA
jgi:hypothetical protein